jgi:hypothetical protein
MKSSDISIKIQTNGAISNWSDRPSCSSVKGQAFAVTRHGGCLINCKHKPRSMRGHPLPVRLGGRICYV